MTEPVNYDAVLRTSSRAKWSNPIEFLLSCIGDSVGLGNVWRFPYLCYKNGGAAFLLAYVIMQLLVGKPLYFMELAVAQYAGKGPVRMWDLNPAARGLGITMCLISLEIGSYYNVLMAYILYYFFASFFPELPWKVCKKEWPENCITDRTDVLSLPVCENSPSLVNCTCTEDEKIDKMFPNCLKPYFHSTNLFFHKEVIQESANISEFGYPSWKLSLLLALSWIIVLACMIKGIKSTAKVVYFTATFPYVVLLILLVRGATLPGAIDGVKFFMLPNFSLLASRQLWIEAAGQMFFSLSLSMGTIPMFASYNMFNHSIYRDALIISTCDLATSLLSGFVIFTTFGYQAQKTGSSILDVADSSYGLAFVAYPEVLSTLGAANIWSVLFFFMLYTLGLDSQFALLEVLTTYLIDDFVWVRKNKAKMRLGLGALLFLVGIALVAPGGQYLVDVLDVYGATYPLVIVAFLECVSIMWIYGMNRVLADVAYMNGKPLKVLCYWKFVWFFCDPLFLGTLTMMILVDAEIPSYNDGSKYGTGMLLGCWAVSFFTFLPVPLWFLLHVRATKRIHGYVGFKQFMGKIFEPHARWGPADGTHPLALHRINTVWADVLDWKCLEPNPDPAHIEPMRTDSVTDLAVSDSLKPEEPLPGKFNPDPEELLPGKSDPAIQERHVSINLMPITSDNEASHGVDPTPSKSRSSTMGLQE